MYFLLVGITGLRSYLNRHYPVMTNHWPMQDGRGPEITTLSRKSSWSPEEWCWTGDRSALLLAGCMVVSNSTKLSLKLRGESQAARGSHGPSLFDPDHFSFAIGPSAPWWPMPETG